MSYCKQEGKDTVIFVTKDDHEGPVTKEVISVLDDDPEDEEEGIILPNGEINWNCPCLGGMASGPCGPEFREAFSCFHYSEADPKGSDCIEKFRDMQGCMVQYPDLYPSGKERQGESDESALPPIGNEDDDELLDDIEETENDIQSKEKDS